MKKVFELMKNASEESILYLRSLKEDPDISSDLKQKLITQLETIDQTLSISSNGITRQWVYLMKSEQVNQHSYALGQMSALICSQLPTHQIEKFKNIMIATSVVSNYLCLVLQKEF